MEYIEKYFESIAWKYLSSVDADPSCSNQHEVGGLVKAGFKQYLGDPGDEILKYPARFILLSDDEENSISVDGSVTWYDSRRGKAHRSPELRLYYDSNPVTEAIASGMLFVIAKTRNNSFHLIFTKAGSSGEQQLRWLFGLDSTDETFESKRLDYGYERSSWAALWVLEQLGIEVQVQDDNWLEKIIVRFKGKFPSTREFSKFARELIADVDAISDPDTTLVMLMDTEEHLFRLLERHLVEQRLAEGFSEIDSFIGYSLSVQNRRKCRVGYALEHHLEYIFTSNQIRFERGAETENRTKPDFLFPGAIEYHNTGFPDEGLTMLGVKSTCKDRWRQVLAEAKRIHGKHLATLEPGISSFQTNEMKDNNLQLIVPKPIHETYTQHQRSWLWSIRDFITEVKERQGRYVSV